MNSIVHNIVSALLYATLIVNFVSAFRSLRAVRGSHQRYVWATWRRTTTYLIIAFFLIDAAVRLAGHQYGPAAISLFVALVDIALERRFRDDDDFWNRLGRKMKRGLRSLARSLGPRPAASGAGA